MSTLKWTGSASDGFSYAALLTNKVIMYKMNCMRLVLATLATQRLFVRLHKEYRSVKSVTISQYSARMSSQGGYRLESAVTVIKYTGQKWMPNSVQIV